MCICQFLQFLKHLDVYIVIPKRQKMNSPCVDVKCLAECCNYFGYCPNYSSFSYYQSECYYYYQDYQSSPGVIAGAVVGSLAAVFVAVAIACYCYKRKQQLQLIQNMATNQTNNPNIAMFENSNNRLIINQPITPTPHPYPYPTPNYPYPTSNYSPAATFPMYGDISYGQPNYGQPIYPVAYTQPVFSQPMYPQPSYNQPQPIIISNL